MRQKWTYEAPGQPDAEIEYDLAHRGSCDPSHMHAFQDVLGYQDRFWASVCLGCGAAFPPTHYLIGREHPSLMAIDPRVNVRPVDGNYEPGAPELAGLLALRPLRAFKLVDHDLSSPFAGPWGAAKVAYEFGKTFHADAVELDLERTCGAGLHAGTLGWVRRHWRPGLRLLEVGFEEEDIACVPKRHGGKIRLRRLEVLRERDDVPGCRPCRRGYSDGVGGFSRKEAVWDTDLSDDPDKDKD